MHEARATEAVDHLQAAALELIEAARAFLDVLEELVGDRERFGDATDVMGAAAGAAARFAGLVSPPADTAPPAPADPAPPVVDQDARSPLERIPVS